MNHLTIWSGIFCLVATLPALAGTNTPALDNIGSSSPMDMGQMYGIMMQRFNQSDTDHSGTLSRTEAAGMPMVAEHFDQIDSNGDGQISPAELKSAFQQQMQ